MSNTTNDASPKPTIVLVHGLFLNWSSWENWVTRYSMLGHQVLAPAWPGLEGSVNELRADPSPLFKLSIQRVVDHFDKLVRGLVEPPIIMGHSFGGLIAQLLAYRGLASPSSVSMQLLQPACWNCRSRL